MSQQVELPCVHYENELRNVQGCVRSHVALPFT